MFSSRHSEGKPVPPVSPVPPVRTVTSAVAVPHVWIRLPSVMLHIVGIGVDFRQIGHIEVMVTPTIEVKGNAGA